ncbi:hypothetical protein [Nocardioides pakistanensis]
MTETRVPAGVPAGGQFAAQARDEAAVALGASTSPATWSERAAIATDRYEHATVADTVVVAANLTEEISEPAEPGTGSPGGVTRVYSGEVAFRVEDEIEDGVVVTSPAGQRLVFAHSGDDTIADPWVDRPAAGNFFRYSEDAPGGRGEIVAEHAAQSPVLDGLDWSRFDRDVATGTARDFEPRMWRLVRDADGRARSVVVMAEFSADVTYPERD